MADKDTVWTAVKARYDSASLISLTNINDRDQTAIDDTVGTEAANGTLNLWPAYAQVEFDVSDGLHLEVAVRGTIAMLYERGGTSTDVAKIEWEEVFSNDGLMGKLKRTGPRGHQAPSSNSGVTTSSESSAGRNVMGWSDRKASGAQFMTARRRLADGL